MSDTHKDNVRNAETQKQAYVKPLVVKRDRLTEVAEGGEQLAATS